MPLTRSTRSEEEEGDESSDYAYIDRSTHSITGYMNNQRGGRRRSQSGGGPTEVIRDDIKPSVSPSVMRQINLSPYATTELVKKHKKTNKASAAIGAGGRDKERVSLTKFFACHEKPMWLLFCPEFHENQVVFRSG